MASQEKMRRELHVLRFKVNFDFSFVSEKLNFVSFSSSFDFWPSSSLSSSFESDSKKAIEQTEKTNFINYKLLFSDRDPW